MRPEDILEMFRKHPFEAFRIHLETTEIGVGETNAWAVQVRCSMSCGN